MIDYSRVFGSEVDFPSDFVPDSMDLEQTHQIDVLDWKIVLCVDLAH